MLEVPPASRQVLVGDGLAESSVSPRVLVDDDDGDGDDDDDDDD